MKHNLLQRVSFGVSGAAGVGKTTLIAEIIKLASPRYSVKLSKDVARSLLSQGVRINTESQVDDYLAFLAVRFRATLQLQADLVIHERTLLDVLTFMELNGHAHGWLKELTEELVQWQIKKLSIYFYVPIEFKTRQDGVRITDPDVNRRVDQITHKLLRKYRPDFVTLTGSVSERVNNVVESLSKLGFNLKLTQFPKK